MVGVPHQAAHGVEEVVKQVRFRLQSQGLGLGEHFRILLQQAVEPGTVAVAGVFIAADVEIRPIE